MATKLARVDLTKGDVEKKVKQECDRQENAGFRLAAAFESQFQLVLIFQSST
jgi:hypothetical protein